MGPRLLVVVEVVFLIMLLWWMAWYRESYTTPPPIPIYVINLERRPDRLQQCVAQFSPNRVRVVRAVDGKDIETETPSSMTLGEIGCFLSHQKALELIATSSAPHGIVLEDDAIIDIPSDRFTRLLEVVPKDTDVVALGCNALPASKMRHVVGEVYALHDYDFYGAHALLYTKRGAVKILEAMRRDGPKEPFDLWLGRLGVTMYVVSPPLAHPRNIQDSETQRTR